MAQTTKLQTVNSLPGGKPLFGPKPAQSPEKARTIQDRLQRLVSVPAPKPKQTLVDQLNERLQEKYREYERAALRLELRGEHDAAKVLRQAAGRARLLRNTQVEEGGLA